MKYAVKNIEKDGQLVAVEIPIINVRIDLEDIAGGMTWEQAMEYAKSKGKRLLSKEDVGILIYLKDQLPEKLKGIGCWTFSVVEEDGRFRYTFLVATSSAVGYSNKYSRFYAVPLSDLTT